MAMICYDHQRPRPIWSNLPHIPDSLRHRVAPLHSSATNWDPTFAAMFGLMQRSGMPILAGADAQANFLLQEELALYVEKGMTPLQALQTATLNPAMYLGVADSLGTVGPGKLADLVLLDANPLADIHNTARIRAVVANSRYFDRTALDGLLAEVMRIMRPDSTQADSARAPRR